MYPLSGVLTTTQVSPKVLWTKWLSWFFSLAQTHQPRGLSGATGMLVASIKILVKTGQPQARAQCQIFSKPVMTTIDALMAFVGANEHFQGRESALALYPSCIFYNGWSSLFPRSHLSRQLTCTQ